MEPSELSVLITKYKLRRIYLLISSISIILLFSLINDFVGGIIIATVWTILILLMFKVKIFVKPPYNMVYASSQNIEANDQLKGLKLSEAWRSAALKVGSWYITKSGLLMELSLFNFSIFPLGNCNWVYIKELRTYRMGIPTGKYYTLILQFNDGHREYISLRKKRVYKLMEEIAPYSVNAKIGYK